MKLETDVYGDGTSILRNSWAFGAPPAMKNGPTPSPPRSPRGRGGFRGRLSSTASLLLMLLVGCAAPGAPPAAGPAAAPATSEVRKTLTIAQPRAREGFGPWFITGSARALQYEELHTNFLVSTDATGNKVGQLAVRLPALEDGTIAILPDGRMQTTWNLQPAARWHDGAALTAHDVVFGWQVAEHPEIPIQRSPTRRAIEAVEALDSLTAVITYRTTFYLALDLGMRDFYVLPQHLLAGAFQGDKEIGRAHV